MKRLVALMMVVILMGISFGAYAEQGASAELSKEELLQQIQQLQAAMAALEVEEQAEEEVELGTQGTQAIEAPAPVTEKPNGTKISLNEAVSASGLARFFIKSSEVTDLVQATEAAEDSAKLTPEYGYKFVCVKLVYHPVEKKQNFGGMVEYSLNINGQTDFDKRMLLESGVNSVDGTKSFHLMPDCSDSNPLSYLVNVLGTDQMMYSCRAEWNYQMGGGSSNYEDYYYLFDLVFEVPEQALETANTAYLQLKIGESEFYYPVSLR